MYQTGVSSEAQREGIGVEGPRLFLPLELARKVGAFSFDLEVGTYLPWHGNHEDIIGVVVGQQMTPRFDLDGEIYDDHVRGAPHVTTLDVGGRYHLHRGLNLLFMGGRSLGGDSAGRVEFMGYLGRRCADVPGPCTLPLS